MNIYTSMAKRFFVIISNLYKKIKKIRKILDNLEITCYILFRHCDIAAKKGEKK